MDHRDVIAMAMEIVLERERQRTWMMKELLRAQQVAVREKGRELSMLKRKKKGLLAKKAARKKLVDDFTVFVTAIENNDLEIAQNFDEKAMMNTIATMMNSDFDDDGGFTSVYGDKILSGIDLGLEEKAMLDAIVALENGVGSSGGDNGRFAGGHGGINKAPENVHNLGEEDEMTAAEGTNSDVGEGSQADSYDGSYSRNRRK